MTSTRNAAGTTGQKPQWEGPPENRPRGYPPAKTIQPKTGMPLAKT